MTVSPSLPRPNSPLRKEERLIGQVSEGQRFPLRFLLPFPSDLSIKKSSIFFPPLIASTSHLGLAPRPAQVSPDGPRYFGGTFLPFNVLLPRRVTLAPPSILSNCCSISARRLTSVSSTCSRRSMSASIVIPDRFTFGIVISNTKTRWFDPQL